MLYEKFKWLFDSPYFSIAVTFLAYRFGVFVHEKTKTPLLNPTVVTVPLLIGFLMLAGAPYASYDNGGKLITMFLTPATVLLALPLYRQIQKLKDNLAAILIGISVGAISALLTIWAMANLLKMPRELVMTLAPKSVTTPIGIELSRMLGGIPSLTIAAIVITGITGAVVAPVVCKICRITEPEAIGAAIGTCSHALGTSTAIQMGETQGAVSSLAIGVAGLLTSVAAPWIFRFLI